jgi:hypothetical protein
MFHTWADELPPGGTIIDLGDELVGTIQAHVNASLQAGEYLPKDVFYLSGNWKNVSQQSCQTDAQARLFPEHASSLMQGKTEGSVLLDLGAG